MRHPHPARPPVAELGLQDRQTDIAYISSLSFLFISYQIPSIVTAGRHRTGCSGQGWARGSCLSLGMGKTGSFGKKEWGALGERGAIPSDPEPGGWVGGMPACMRCGMG